ncbi:MAG: type III-A CRISPR-associated RAMP protein Csm5 [Candidatus Parvarchaeota archaeon]|nr:type III-A CRISPR-associated RAMP protein Csm5 [Candidatus Jingweiarchaeum tengchongense]
MTTINDRIKESKQKLGEKIPCSIEVLTPVHVGSGVKLTNKIDFIISEDRQRLTVIDQTDLISYLEENPDEIDNFLKNKLEKLKKTPKGKTYNIDSTYVGEIYQFERDGNGNHYIPGSSIKGAIRTSLLAMLFDSLSDDEKEKLLIEAKEYKKGENWASEPILAAIFGKDSNYNLMRVIQFYDTYFTTELELSRLHILSLKNESVFGWKKMGKDRQTNKPFPLQENPKYSTSIFVEALPIGALGYTTINFDNFLVNNSVAKEELKFSDSSIRTIMDFINTFNSYSQKKLEKEKDFFSNLQSPKKLNSVINEIDKLLNKIKNLSKDEFILRISWGSGWKGMTGDYLDANWLSNFRRKYQLGKKNFSIFPKTRRIVFEDDEPKYLTGWAKIKLNDIVLEGRSGLMGGDDKMKEIIPTKESPRLNVIAGPMKEKGSSANVVLAEIIDDKSKPPKVKILEGEHSEKETIMPGTRLEGLELSKGAKVYVKLYFDKKNLQKAEYKGKAK